MSIFTATGAVGLFAVGYSPHHVESWLVFPEVQETVLDSALDAFSHRASYVCISEADTGCFWEWTQPETGLYDHKGLCPICGEEIDIVGKTTDGRLIGSCRDAFSKERWDEV